MLLDFSDRTRTGISKLISRCALLILLSASSTTLSMMITAFFWTTSRKALPFPLTQRHSKAVWTFYLSLKTSCSWIHAASSFPCPLCCLLYTSPEPTRQAEISYAVFCLKKKYISLYSASDSYTHYLTNANAVRTRRHELFNVICHSRLEIETTGESRSLSSTGMARVQQFKNGFHSGQGKDDAA